MELQAGGDGVAADSPGDRLGLYRVLDGAGTVTAEELAGRTGLHPRWLREWLRGNAAADLLWSDDGERFELAAVLTREGDSLQFAAGAFGPPPDPALVDDLANAFRTGTGPWRSYGSLVGVVGQLIPALLRAFRKG